MGRISSKLIFFNIYIFERFENETVSADCAIIRGLLDTGRIRATNSLAMLDLMTNECARH